MALRQCTPDQDVATYVQGLGTRARRDDCLTLIALFGGATGEPAAMWGRNLIGFGQRQRRLAGGQEIDQPLLGFTPRDRSFTLWFGPSHPPLDPARLDALGPVSTGPGVLHLHRLADIDLDVLRALIVDVIGDGAST